jgi:hypothetical protein
VKDAVLSPDVYAALVTKAGLHWRGPTARPATDAFLIFVAALHTSLDNYLDVLDWFREIFIPLIRVAEEMYYKNSGNTSERNPDTYAPGPFASNQLNLLVLIYNLALDLLAQIKVIQFQWQVWNGSHATLPTSTSLQKARIPPGPLLFTRADAVPAYLEYLELCRAGVSNTHRRGHGSCHPHRRNRPSRVYPPQVDPVPQAQ